MGRALLLARKRKFDRHCRIVCFLSSNRPGERNNNAFIHVYTFNAVTEGLGVL